MTKEIGFGPEKVQKCALELCCDVCGYYPTPPVHGHFACPSCKNITRCCEGMPLDV
ncbi:MAG: hypothetical protein WBP03_02725 [Candidatus Saccharimonadales bacterium]|jgi:hypothetical protein